MDEKTKELAANMYDKLLRDRKSGNKDGVANAARCLMDLYPDNPFEEGTKPYDLLYIMGIQHHRWKISNLKDCPGKREMVRLAGELADMNLPNPWRSEPPSVVLGVIPEEPSTKEEKHGIFGRLKKAKQNDG